MPLNYLSKKCKKWIPCTIIIALTLLFTGYFYYSSITENIMTVYYSTFTRIFSILFGVSLAFVSSSYNKMIPKKLENCNLPIYIAYILLLIALFIFTSSESNYYAISMILASIISCRLIDYSLFQTKEIKVVDKIINKVSKVSYEVYLVQYPVIFILQNLPLNSILKVLIIIFATSLLAVIIYFLTKYNGKVKLIGYLCPAILIAVELYGSYLIYIAKDHTQEMKELENQLLENQKLIEEKSSEYALNLKKEEEEWASVLADFDSSENRIHEMVSSLPVVEIGDSVLLGAVTSLYETFPNGYFDGKVSRTAYEAEAILQSLNSRNMLGNPVVFNLGANGNGPDILKDEIMAALDGRTVFWLTVTNDYEVFVNDRLRDYASRYENLHIIDWENISRGHTEYFIAGGIHLTEIGMKAYAEAIYEGIYQYYLDEFNRNKDEVIKKHEEEKRSKIVFFGNDICINAFEGLKEKFDGASFYINKDYTFDVLY